MKKLPFEVKAGKEYDLILTTLLGIIKPNLMDFEAWMCSHLIDIVYHPHTPNNYMFYLPGFWNNDNNCLRSSYINVGSDVFDGQILDLVSVVNGAIDRGLYVRGHWNRNRRLAEAGMELLSSNEKIIDIALTYGYDSHDSFTKAFSRFHGVTPSAVRRGGCTIKAFAQLRLQFILG